MKKKGIIKGEAYLVRYADDFIVMFQYQEQANKFYKLLIERLRKFKLEITEDKTKLIPFGRFKGTKETFNFLGFLHFNSVTKTGKYTISRKISKEKKQAKKRAITKYIKENRHKNIAIIIQSVNRKITGLYAYYGINGMFEELKSIYIHIYWELFRILGRRGQSSYFQT